MARNIKDYSTAPSLTNVKLVGFNESTNTMYKVPTTLFPSGGGGTGSPKMKTLWKAPGNNTTYASNVTIDTGEGDELEGRTFSLVIISKMISFSGKTGYMNSPVTHIPFINFDRSGANYVTGVIFNDWTSENWINIDVLYDEGGLFSIMLTDDYGMGEAVKGISRVDIIFYD